MVPRHGHPERALLADVRAGEFEGLEARFARLPPDVGEIPRHDRAGAIAIGARNLLVAFNVELHSDDLALAKTIARSLRERNGGLSGLRALGLRLSEGVVQVSLNVTDVEATPLYRIVELIARLAAKNGVAIRRSELIGLVPRAAWKHRPATIWEYIVKRLVLLIACAIFALAGSSARAQQTGGPGDAGIYTTTLKNGLRVVVVEDHAAPVVQTAVWYRFRLAGRNQRQDRTCACDRTHDVSRNRGSHASGLDDIVARLGAQMNGQTSYDYTEFYFMMPADKLDVGLAIEADRMQHAAMRQSDWNIERGAVLNELEGDDSSPFFNLLSKVRAAAYPDQPNGRTPTGTLPTSSTRPPPISRSTTTSGMRRTTRRWSSPAT